VLVRKLFNHVTRVRHEVSIYAKFIHKIIRREILSQTDLLLEFLDPWNVEFTN